MANPNSHPTASHDPNDRRNNGKGGGGYFAVTTFFLASLFLFSIFFLNRGSIDPSLSNYPSFIFSAGAGVDSEPNPITPHTHLDLPAETVAGSNAGAEIEIETVTEASSVAGDERFKISDGVDSDKSTESDRLDSLPTTTEDSPDQEKDTVLNEKQNSAYENGGVDDNLGTKGPNEVDDSNSESGSDSKIVDELAERLKGCDLYMGKWVRDEEYPIYKPGSCLYVDEAFNCQNNGRPDSEYLKWRWKPDGCDLPRFNATDFLVRLSGKKLMLVGDSMNRNQFESILCLLREGLPDKRRMFETHGYKISKGRGYFSFKFKDYNCIVEFVRSHFLVREGVRINAQGNSNPTLSIDRIDKTANRWKRADILVFNTGHWWTHGKTARGKNYYKEGNYIYPKFDSVVAYKRALATWAKWIKDNLKPSRHLVIYRGYSSAHFRGGDWDSGGSCNGEKEPILSGGYLDTYPQKMQIVEDVFRETKVPAVLLNVTRLTNFRKDGHPSIYGKNTTDRRRVSKRRQDCSHWCLPGVPDAWNELIYAQLILRQSLFH